VTTPTESNKKGGFGINDLCEKRFNGGLPMPDVLESQPIYFWIDFGISKPAAD